MPSYSQDINVDLSQNVNSYKNNQKEEEKNGDVKYVANDLGPNNAPSGLNAGQKFAFALRDFLGPQSMGSEERGLALSSLSHPLPLPFIDEHIDAEDVTQSEDELQQSRGTEEILNNAACRLRRWRAASRKLRRPRIINNLCTKDENGGTSKVNEGHTDLADRLRSLAAAGSMSASAGELLSLAPPPPAATAPPSPSCLLTPTLADQSAAEYFRTINIQILQLFWSRALTKMRTIRSKWAPTVQTVGQYLHLLTYGNDLKLFWSRCPFRTKGTLYLLRRDIFDFTKGPTPKIVLRVINYHKQEDGSSPECCAAGTGLELSSSAGIPGPPPGPRYKLATEGTLKVCCFQHTRTVVDKILATKFLRRWESHVLCLLDDHVISKTPSGFLEKPLSYSCMQEVYCISRWDPARKYCLRIVMPHGSLLLQAKDAYTRDQWYYSIVWRRNMIRYRNIMTKSVRKEIVLKELKNMVDFAMTTPLQDESVTRAPLDILTSLLSEDKESPDWEEWAENATSVAAPLLAERCVNGELCALLARLCHQRPRAAPLPALAPPVRRVIMRNVDFGKFPNARLFVREYISALSSHNSGASLVRRFVEVTHGMRAVCPHPRAAPNLVAVALAAIDDYFRECTTKHVCTDREEQVMCFADILEQMSEYDDWRATVASILQPVPFCAAALKCPNVSKRLGNVLKAIAEDPRCSVHACVAPANAARPNPPSWLNCAGPSNPLISLPQKQLCQLWGDMMNTLLSCCMKKKSFLQSMSKQLPDFLLVAMTEHRAALEALCLILEWEVMNGEQIQLEIISALQGTDLGMEYYKDLCQRQQNLQILQSKGGPTHLALPVRATDADVAALLEAGALGSLEFLSLAFTHVTSACAYHLIKLPSLRYLNLWSTNFGDSGVELIAEHLTRLQVLNLCETQTSDRGVEALSGLSSLRQINLNSTKLSSEGLDILRSRLPHLEDYDVRYTEAF